VTDEKPDKKPGPRQPGGKTKEAAKKKGARGSE
jgi:hypothetical protein